MNILRVFGLALALFISMAFVVEGPRGGGTDAKDHLERSPRWGLTSGSMLSTGERGLGGGLEYAIDASICEMTFIDGADCLSIHAAIDDALSEWASGHPALVFTNVSGRVGPAAPRGTAQSVGQGAEIDFFGASGREFPPFLNPSTTGYTIFYEGDPAPLVLTNGQLLQSVGRIQSADVRLNAELCYYLDTAKGRPNCLHFPSIVLHEIGHALGLGHPDDQTRFNLDRDSDPSNELQIDCRQPSQGLRTSARFEGAAVLVGRDVQGPGRWRRGLTWDDVAARNALYPHCGIQRRERFSQQWGASGQSGYSTAPRSDQARVKAVLACQATGGVCRVTADFCAFE